MGLHGEWPAWGGWALTEFSATLTSISDAYTAFRRNGRLSTDIGM